MTEKAIAKGEKIRHHNENCFHIKTPFFDQKVKTLFRRFDYDCNGKIEKDDLEHWANNLIIAGSLTGEKADELRRNITAVWDCYFLPADSDQDGSVQYLELVQYMQAAQRGGKDDPKVRKAIMDALPLIFQAIDLDDDGKISFDEFKLFFRSFDVTDEKFSKQIFRELDTNHDTFLSEQEFVEAGADFFMGLNNESPSRYFFGPLS